MAMACPIPELPPVTMAVFPSSPRIAAPPGSPARFGLTVLRRSPALRCRADEAALAGTGRLGRAARRLPRRPGRGGPYGGAAQHDLLGRRLPGAGRRFR